jgi:hypothetical protein
MSIQHLTRLGIFRVLDPKGRPAGHFLTRQAALAFCAAADIAASEG